MNKKKGKKKTTNNEEWEGGKPRRWAHVKKEQKCHEI